MEANDLARKTAEIASRDIGVREKGKNDGKRIRQYQAAVGIKPPQPYCIAAVCCWIKEACAALAVQHQILFSPNCLRFLEYARKTGHAMMPSELGPEHLPCVGIIDVGKPGGDGHAFLIVGMDDDGSLHTIEANSNDAGARDGQGVVALDGRRNISSLAGVVRIV
jgi:hypothetical protein